MPTRIKFSTYLQTLFTNLKKFFGRFLITADLTGECLSKLNYIFAMSFLNNEIRQDLLTKIAKTISGCHPSMDCTLISFVGSPSIYSRIDTRECIHQPNDETFISTINLKAASMMSYNFSVERSRCLTNKEATFTINNSSHIGQNSRFILIRDILFRSMRMRRGRPTRN